MSMATKKLTSYDEKVHPNDLVKYLRMRYGLDKHLGLSDTDSPPRVASFKLLEYSKCDGKEQAAYFVGGASRLVCASWLRKQFGHVPDTLYFSVRTPNS